MDKSKRKPQSNIGKPFFKILFVLIAIPIVSAISCYGFAEFGGEWVSSSLIPVPPDSELIDVVYATDTYSEYVLRHDIYTNSTTADILRDWYINDARILLSPIPTGNSVIEYNGYYGTPSLGISNTLKNLHTVSVWLATDWFDEQIARCQRVQVYFDFEKFTEDFPDVPAVNKALTYTIVTTCWPNVK